MKLQINIDDDEELRAFIKAQVTAALKNVGRADADHALESAINNRVGNTIDTILKYNVDTRVHNYLGYNNDVIRDAVKNGVKEYVTKILEEQFPANVIKEMVTNEIKAKVRKLMD